jgi:hypothetical protein
MRLRIAKREDEVIQRRRAGMTWAMIGKELGYANESGPFKVFKKAVKRLLAENTEKVDVMRWLEHQRNEAMLRGGLWNRAQRGELPAIDRVLAIQKSTRDLFGLDAPKKNLMALTSPEAIEDGPEALTRAVREEFGEKAARPMAANEDVEQILRENGARLDDKDDDVEGGDDEGGSDDDDGSDDGGEPSA